MKKLLLILLCVPLIGLGQQQTYVPDDNFEQRLINQGYDNILDDYVTTANINTVDYLDVSYQSISDLTGIEDFTMLEEIDCSHNNLTSLDLSSNLLLGEVICSYNQIISLDFSNNHDLSWIECENNALISLNLRNGNNSNTWVFRASNNPSLTCIDVDDASWSTIEWTVSNGSIDAQHYFHGILESGWIDVGSFNLGGASFLRDFIIDANNIMYVIDNHDFSVFKYDTAGSGNWIDIGDYAHAIALDHNNDLHKVYLECYYNTPQPPQGNDPYEVTKAALKLMKYNGSSWILTSVDTIYSQVALGGWYGPFKIEDFVIDANGNAYVSLMVNDFSLDFNFDFARIHVKKYDGVWSDLDSTGILKHHYGYFAVPPVLRWWEQFDLKTTLDIHPVTGNLLIAGQQGYHTGLGNFGNYMAYNVVGLSNNVIKEYNGLHWNILGGTIPLGPCFHHPGGSFLATNTNGDIVCAFTNDWSEFGDPYGKDTVMVYKYNAGSNSWDTLIGGNPNIEMFYVNNLSMDINSDGEPCFAFEGFVYPPYIAINTGMQMVVKYNNNSNQWNNIASPVNPNSFTNMVDDWNNPIMRYNTDNKLFINYYRTAPSGNILQSNVITYQNADSSFCNTGVNFIPFASNKIKKSLVMVTDILGRMARNNIKNKLLFYIYDDGTVEKKMIIE